LLGNTVAQTSKNSAQIVPAQAVILDWRDCIPEIDAAIIAAPTGVHSEIAAAMLKSGKHVLVEKPMTIDRADANQLLGLAAAKRLTLQVGRRNAVTCMFRGNLDLDRGFIQLLEVDGDFDRIDPVIEATQFICLLYNQIMISRL